MNAGRLNQQVVFYKPVTEKTEYGSTEVKWEQAFSTKAYVNVDSGSRALENYEIFHNYVTTFVIRKYHKVHEEMRILWKGKYYRIDYIIYDDPGQSINIKATLLNE